MTAIFVDASGSMETPISAKSTVTCSQIASVMGAIAAKRSNRAYLFEFATDVRPVRFSKTDTVLGIAARFKNEGVNGHCTNAWKIPYEVSKLQHKVDRVIILSDMQTWTDNSMSSGREILCNEWGRKIKSDVWLHCVHLNGSGDSPVDQGSRVNQIGGFSEKIFEMLLQVEGVGVDVEVSQEFSIPTMDQIRQNHTL